MIRTAYTTFWFHFRRLDGGSHYIRGHFLNINTMLHQTPNLTRVDFSTRFICHELVTNREWAILDSKRKHSTHILRLISREARPRNRINNNRNVFPTAPPLVKHNFFSNYVRLAILLRLSCFDFFWRLLRWITLEDSQPGIHRLHDLPSVNWEIPITPLLVHTVITRRLDNPGEQLCKLFSIIKAL